LYHFDTFVAGSVQVQGEVIPIALVVHDGDAFVDGDDAFVSLVQDEQ